MILPSITILKFQYFQNLIYIQRSGMIPLEKLKSNLDQSQQWSSTFKKEIKQSMEELTLKNQQIAELGRLNLNIQSTIEKQKSQLKSLNDQKLKTGYKIDKIQIKIEEVRNRVKLFEEIKKKKEEWNKQLTNKMLLLEIDIEKNIHAFEDHEEGESLSELVAESSVSGSVSSSLTFKEDSIKKVLGDPRTQIDARLKRIKKMESNYLREYQNNSQLQKKMQKAQRKEKRLKEQLQFLQKSFPQAEKENMDFHQTTQGQQRQKNIKQTRTAAATLRHLDEKNERLNYEITKLHNNIEQFHKTLNCLIVSDAEAMSFHNATVNLAKDVKKEKNSMYCLKSYMLGISN